MKDKKYELLAKATHMISLTYESEPRLLKGKLADAGLTGHRVTKLQEIQVNPIRQYKKLKARVLGIKPSEVKLEPLKPGWTHLDKGMITDGKVTLFQAAPVRIISEQFLVDGVPATEGQVDQIKRCLGAPGRLPPVSIRTYRLDRIKRVAAEHQVEIDG